MPAIVLHNTMGIAFIGVIVAAILHGVSCVQAWYYFTHQHDRWPLKSLVAAVMFFDTVHQALISHTVYTYLITNYSNPLNLGVVTWSLLVEVLFNGLTALLVQSFLAMRVWRLSNRNFYLTSAVILLVFAEFGCISAYFGIAIARVKTYADLARLEPLSVTVNALAAAGDVLIAVTLCWLLHRSRTGFSRSDTMINTLILFAVNTGLLTSLCAVASLISILVLGHTYLYIAFFFCIGRLYANSLLATLNARKMIRSAALAAEGHGYGLSTVDGTNANISFSLRGMDASKSAASAKSGRIGLPNFGSRRPTNISIKIDTTQEFCSDHQSISGSCKSPLPSTSPSDTQVKRFSIVETLSITENPHIEGEPASPESQHVPGCCCFGIHTEADSIGRTIRESHGINGFDCDEKM